MKFSSKLMFSLVAVLATANLISSPIRLWSGETPETKINDVVALRSRAEIKGVVTKKNPSSFTTNKGLEEEIDNIDGAFQRSEMMAKEFKARLHALKAELRKRENGEKKNSMSHEKKYTEFPSDQDENYAVTQ